MTKEKALERLKTEIKSFLNKEGCKLSDREQYKFTSSFLEYIQFLVDLNDIDIVDQLITSASVKYADLKAESFEASPSTPGAFKHGGDRSETIRRKKNDIGYNPKIGHKIDLTPNEKRKIIRNAKEGERWKFELHQDANQQLFPKVNTENLEQDPEWEKGDFSMYPDPIKVETSYKSALVEDLKEDFSDSSFKILEKNIFPETPKFEPSSRVIKAKWWREVQAFRHVIAIQYCRSMIDEGKSDNRVKYSNSMKKEAHRFYEAHAEEVKNIAAKAWVETKLIPHLAKKFNKETDFFKESTLRKDWLKLTS